MVGSKGVYLSGGETQRIAIARAILKNAPIVVMDEATAYADPENEQQIQKAFEGLVKGKTVIMIAHRLSTIQDADLILVMKQGALVESGTHGYVGVSRRRICQDVEQLHKDDQVAHWKSRRGIPA